MTNEQLLDEITKLTERFTRTIPQTQPTSDRLAEEVDLIVQHRSQNIL